MRFSMLYSGEQILSFKSCLVFYAGDSLTFSRYLPFGMTNVCKITASNFRRLCCSFTVSEFEYRENKEIYLIKYKDDKLSTIVYVTTVLLNVP